MLATTFLINSRTENLLVLIGQTVIDVLDFWDSVQDRTAHLVHGVLHRRAVLLRERLHGDSASIAPRLVELGNSSLHSIQSRECLPGPSAIHIRGQNSVPDLRQCCVFIPHEAVELRTGALEHQESNNSRADINSLAPGDLSLDVAGLVSVAIEGVWVWFAVNSHACPSVCDDLDVRGCEVRVGLDEVGAEDGGKELGGCDGVLFGFDVDGVFHGVGGYNHAVVGFGVSADLLEELEQSREEIVRCLDSTFEEYADCHLCDGLNTGPLVTLDFVDADIVLAIAG